MTPRRLVHLTPAERKRALARTMVRFFVIFAAVIGAYYLLPLGGGSGDVEAILRLAGGALLFVAIMIWEVRRILTADLPELRAVESIALAVPFFLTTYGAAYVTLSAISPGSFSQPMNRTGGLYFSIVTFGTVGYGDIAPVSDLARILVSTQILGDLVFIALVLRIVASASRLTLERWETRPDDEERRTASGQRRAGKPFDTNGSQSGGPARQRLPDTGVDLPHLDK